MEAVLQNILINTYNPDKQLRSNAENALKNFIFAEGTLSIDALHMGRQL